jgi:hypothetical protein
MSIMGVIGISIFSGRPLVEWRSFMKRIRSMTFGSDPDRSMLVAFEPAG